MIAGEYAAFADPYCYPGSDCLKNRLNIRDATVLEAFEFEMFVARSVEAQPTGRFGPAHYRKIHRHLFQDVYHWAGRYRTIRIGKEGNWFCYPEHIPAQMDQLFCRLIERPFVLGASAHNFVAATAGFLAELNAIHPFREGNGRTQLVFLHLIGLRAGHPFQFTRIRQETFLPAMIASFSGNLFPLISELGSLLGSE